MPRLTDDFGIAIDGIANVGVSPAGYLNIALQVGYKGDCWLVAVSFALDLLVYRPSLDKIIAPNNSNSQIIEVRQSLDLINAVVKAWLGTH